MAITGSAYEIAPARAVPPACQADSWLQQLHPKTLVFYAYPLLAKWLKTFKYPETLIISQQPTDTRLWEKRLKTRSITWMNFERVLSFHGENPDRTWPLILWIDRNIDPEHIEALSPLLQKGGALLMVTQNLQPRWDTLQKTLEAQDITQLYPVGFHPQGAVAWWPASAPWLLGPGKLLDVLAAFFPGRYELGLRFGQCWMVRGFKRDDVTHLT